MPSSTSRQQFKEVTRSAPVFSCFPVHHPFIYSPKHSVFSFTTLPVFFATSFSLLHPCTPGSPSSASLLPRLVFPPGAGESPSSYRVTTFIYTRRLFNCHPIGLSFLPSKILRSFCRERIITHIIPCTTTHPPDTWHSSWII